MPEYKGYSVENDGVFSMKSIKNKGQGPAPNPLRGRFTSYNAAYAAIDGYLESNKKKVTNGTTKDSGTD